MPTRVIKSHKDAPWLNQFIKRIMKLHNKLYLCVKCTQTESDWSACRYMRNVVNNLMKEAYHNYCKHLFEDSYSSNRKRFWSLIKHQQKDFSYITSLKVNEHCVTSPFDKFK